MNCIICCSPTGEPKDSYGFTMPNIGNGKPPKDRFVRVHKSCLRSQGRTRAERHAKIVDAYRRQMTGEAVF